MKIGKKDVKIKPVPIWKAVLIYIICAVLIVGMLAGNYYADVYRDLITVFLSGSGTVVTETSQAVCLEVEQEGMVLLKNDNALPLASGAKVTLLGQDSVDFVYGGAGSGSVDTSKAATLKEAMEEEGFEVNPVLWDFYTTGDGKNYRKTVPDETGEGEFAVNEVPASLYSKTETDSFAEYGDAAIVCIGRSGGESSDIPTTELESGSLYLQLDSNERDLLTLACAAFDQVILVVNANNPVELGILEDPEYANITACLWVGGVGQEGIHAVAQAISGAVNPSGRLVDTYAYDSLSAPSSENLGDYTITNSTVNKGDKYIVYSEGIYVGYRYYETRYEDAVLGQGNAGSYDYSETVQFPFGYGLSYTDFAWSDYTVTENEDSFEVSVTVTNTGSTAGKEVVQVYLQSPYTDYDKENNIEKASVELAAFGKTSELEPGASETVVMTVDKEQLKSYDAEGEETYILDAGDYYLAAGKNAHEALNNILAAKGCTTEDGMTDNGDAGFAYTYTVADQDSTTYAVSTVTGSEITNCFDETDIRYYDGEFEYLSRSDWEGTYPATYKDGNWSAPAALLKDLEWDRSVDVVGTGSEEMPVFEEKHDLSASDLTETSYEDEQWTQLIEQLSAEQVLNLVRMGGYATIQLDSIDLPSTQDKDGPSGISGTLVGGQSAMSYPVEVVMASTWNVELMERLGESIGEDSQETGVAGWYAPGVNIHRSPYSGRNFEYFSEDGYLSGQMSGYEVKGARSMGTITYMKHFALNDQETNRYGAAVFANEQAIREVFLKGFEYTVRIGGTNAAMASMNRLGATWSGSCKGLMTDVLRGEWGFEGAVITDQASVPAMFYQDMVSGLAAGTDLWLNTNKTYWKLDSYTELDGTVKDWTGNAAVMQNAARAAKNVAYMVGTSNAMQSQQSTHAWWETLLTILNIVVFGGAFLLLVWITLRLVKTIKTMPRNETTQGDDIVKKPIVALLTVIALVLGIGAGFLVNRMTAGKSSGGSAEIVRTCVYGEIAGNDMNDNDYVEYELTLYSDNTYKFTTTRASNGYSMLVANTVTTAYGTYTMGESSDGYTDCQLSEATRILYSGYSDVGGYNMSYDTQTLTFPVEMPGGIQTEQADFWAQYGAAMTIQLDDANPTRMSFDTGSMPAVSTDNEDEAAEEETETAPETEETVEGMTITSDDGSTTLTLGADGRYCFAFEAYGVSDIGTYTYDGSKLVLTNANGTEASAEGDPLKLHYVSSVSDQLTGDFTIDVSSLTGAGSESEETAVEGLMITSDDGSTTLTLGADGRYCFAFEAYGVSDIGTYTYDGSKLVLTNANGTEASAEGDPLKLHYVSSVSDQLTGDFTIDVSSLKQ